ncbi:TonB-dependent receptor domain-containing protein [Parasphingorhabdus sp.]|uniref:TonB-dependent receptor domain-containing protein n=1 Tax=Parasphingorhabdus sp. TaxID=2709688 RepID=UPI003C771822
MALVLGPCDIVQAQTIISIDIPAGRLSSALRTVSRQANITVVGTSRDLSSIRTPAVKGQMIAASALRRLLNGTDYQARQINSRTFRIERRNVRPQPVPNVPPARAESRPVAVPRPPPPEPVTIVVTATKLDYTLREYPGAAQSISLMGVSTGEAAGGLDNLLSKIPVTSGTALGSGRNKIFVRGIADSSFNGPTQSTIGLYLGEQRLTFSASNPDLRLYDMERLEILEGPQGTLYGAGSIGGVLRMAPAVPNLDGIAATIWASGVATSGGAEGYDVAAMANVPITETAALRAVIYRGQSGGYIDDSLRELENINRSEVTGGRLALHSELSSDWTLQVQGFGQKTEARDGDYIDARFAGLTQNNTIAQPFGAEIWGLNATMAGTIGDMRLVSSTGIVSHDLDTRYDSGGGPNAPPLQAYDETREIELFTHETRLADNRGDPLSWLIGFSALRHQDDYEQLVTNFNGDDPPPFANIVYTISEYALFGEAKHAFNDSLSVMAGGRLVYSQGNTERSFGATNDVASETNALRFLPVAALSWRVSDDVSAYIRHQQGYRTGGITIERTPGGDPQIARFDPDKVYAFETGLKGRLNTGAPVNFSFAMSYMKWRDVQGDLIDNIGFPITRNIGDADIFGLTMQTDTQLTANLRLSSAFFLNQSRVMRVTPRDELLSSMLPNIPPYGAQLGLIYHWDIGNNSELIAAGSLEYTGESVLDIDAAQQVRQGNFASADLSLIWRQPSWEIGLEANNITNTRGNRFSFGNPFKIRQEDQQTPLRPFNIRLSAKIDL